MEILSYFLRNPLAADTLEGVARWRLLDEVVYRKVEETRAALEWLVERGLLLETAVSGASPVFCLNIDRISEAEKLLAGKVRRRRGRA